MLPGPSASANRAADRRHRRANRGPAPCSAVTAPAPLKGEQGAGSGCGYLSAHGEAPARGSGAADGPLWRGWAAHEAQGARAGPDSLRRSRALPSASSWVPAAYLRASRPGTPRAVPRPPARVPTESHGLPAPSSPSPTVSRAPSPPSPAVSRPPVPTESHGLPARIPTESHGLPPPVPTESHGLLDRIPTESEPLSPPSHSTLFSGFPPVSKGPPPSAPKIFNVAPTLNKKRGSSGYIRVIFSLVQKRSPSGSNPSPGSFLGGAWGRRRRPLGKGRGGQFVRPRRREGLSGARGRCECAEPRQARRQVKEREEMGAGVRAAIGGGGWGPQFN